MTGPSPAPVLLDLPGGYAAARGELHRLAAHVLARRRHVLVGRLGLRASPGGIGMPAAGPEHEVLRTSGCWLVRERTGEAAVTDAVDLRGASLLDAARFAGVDLADDSFSVGRDTPPVGDPAAPLALVEEAVAALATWFAFAWHVLDPVVAPSTAELAPSVLQLWPEHFDAGLDVAVGGGRRANLGASPGDAFHDSPYLYVGPWGDERPGDAGFWNAPFGAVLGYEELQQAEDPPARALDFLHHGLARLAPGRTG